jgi:predicted metal-dependent peptidase
MVRTPDDFSGFDRRHIWQGLYVDALENESLDVDVCIDTSGSIDNVQLSLFLAELRGIVGAYPSVRCRLYYADAACHGPFEVDANADFSVAKGGGGTDFQPFFEQTAPTQFTNHAGHGEPRLAIYLTDGEGIFPSEAPDRPVLWVVTPGGADSAKFPFGTVVRMRE